LARRKWLEALTLDPPPPLRQEIEEVLGDVSIMLITTPRQMPEKTDYTIRSGDYLSKLAREFGTTKALIQKSNQIDDPNRIRQGDRLRILNKVDFSIHVRKRANDLVLKMNGEFVKRYRVGTGEFGRTPVGTFKIVDRIVEPVWWRPDGKAIPYGEEGNVLGTRWMKIEATGDTPAIVGYGIHGTWDDDSIGKQSSAGCIRMLNADVEELFMIVPLGVVVTITD
jgi:LysM repeat protein